MTKIIYPSSCQEYFFLLYVGFLCCNIAKALSYILCLGGICCLHHQGRRRHSYPSPRLSIVTIRRNQLSRNPDNLHNFDYLLSFKQYLSFPQLTITQFSQYAPYLCRLIQHVNITFPLTAQEEMFLLVASCFLVICTYIKEVP